MASIKPLGSGLLVVAAMAISGCAFDSHRHVQSLGELPSDQMIVVARVEFDPPLKPHELQVANDRWGRDKQGRFWLVHGDRLLDTLEYDVFNRGSAFNSSRQNRQITTVELNKDFFISAPRDKPYIISGGYFLLSSETAAVAGVRKGMSSININSRHVPLFLPANLTSSDRAVYLGTIRLYRDKALNVRRVEIRDDYAVAQAKFRVKFGENLTLRKSLLKPRPLPATYTSQNLKPGHWR